jgi:hypothetical protein
LAVLLVIPVFTFVLVAIWINFIFLPFSLTIFHSKFEATGIDCSTLPAILALAIWSTVKILTSINVLVCKVISSLTIL